MNKLFGKITNRVFSTNINFNYKSLQLKFQHIMLHDYVNFQYNKYLCDDEQHIINSMAQEFHSLKVRYEYAEKYRQFLLKELQFLSNHVPEKKQRNKINEEDALRLLYSPIPNENNYGNSYMLYDYDFHNNSSFKKLIKDINNDNQQIKHLIKNIMDKEGK